MGENLREADNSQFIKQIRLCGNHSPSIDGARRQHCLSTMENAIRLCSEYITRNYHAGGTVVVVIGLPGSGKSYITAGIAADIFRRSSRAVCIVNYDDFVLSRNDREALRTTTYTTGPLAGRSPWETFENWYNIDLMNDVVRRLRHGESVSYHPYDRDTGKLSPIAKSVTSAELIIVDTGILPASFDTVIMLDCEPDVALSRKIARDPHRSTGELEEMHVSVQLSYWERVRASIPASIVIDNTDYVRPVVHIKA